MKNRIITGIIGLIASAALAVSVISAVALHRQSLLHTQQLEAFHGQLEQLQGELELQQLRRAGLSDWSLQATPWTDDAGADVTMTAVPEIYRDGLRANLVIYYNGEIVADIPCSWDGTAFSATAGLSALNGYNYSCVFTDSGSNPREIVLTSMDEPVLPKLVFLADALDSYCNLSLGDWTAENGTLKMDACYVQVQLPQLAAVGSSLRWEKACLSLQLDGKELQNIPLSLNPGEGSNGYELALQDVSFPLPRMTEESQLDLVLEVTLTNGRTLNDYGASWYMEADRLLLASG